MFFNKKPFYYISLGFFLCIHTVNAWAMITDRTEEEHKSSSPMKHSSDEKDTREFVSEKLGDDLYLCYQPVKTKEDLNLWIDFGAENAKVEFIKCDLSPSKQRVLSDSHGVLNNSFAQTFHATVLVKTSLLKEYSDLAIVYAATLGTQLTTLNDMVEHIEMAMTSHTSPSVPFITHIGIHRQPLWIRNNKPFHKGLSIYLHSFGARIAKRYYPDKDFMFTAPLPIMRELLEKALSKESIWVISPDYNKNKGSSGPLFEEGRNFVFRNLKGEEVFKTDMYFEGTTSSKSDCIWFFSLPKAFGNGKGDGKTYFTFIILKDLGDWSLKNLWQTRSKTGPKQEIKSGKYLEKVDEM